MAQKYASMAAKDTREASTLPSDFDGTITNVQFTKEPPDNYEAAGNPIFGVVTILSDGRGGTGFGPGVTPESPENERTVMQSYSLGAKAGDEFTISPDGYGLLTSGDETATRKGSKFDLFKCSLENEGVPESLFAAGDMSKLIGLTGRWKRIDDEKLLGKARTFAANDKKKVSKFPPQTLVCVKLLSLPGEKAVGKPNGAAVSASPARASTASAGAPEGTLDTVTAEYLVRALSGQKDGKAQRSQLTLLVSKAAIKEATRQDIARRAADEGFLMGLTESGIISGDAVYAVTFDPASKPQVVSIAAV